MDDSGHLNCCPRTHTTLTPNPFVLSCVTLQKDHNPSASFSGVSEFKSETWLKSADMFSDRSVKGLCSSLRLGNRNNLVRGNTTMTTNILYIIGAWHDQSFTPAWHVSRARFELTVFVRYLWNGAMLIDITKNQH